jgi:hypothetical protein
MIERKLPSRCASATGKGGHIKIIAVLESRSPRDERRKRSAARARRRRSSTSGAADMPLRPPKKPKYTVCTSCYFMLPPKLRTRQAARIDDPDFCTAFRDALVWLNASGA